MGWSALCRLSSRERLLGTPVDWSKGVPRPASCPLLRLLPGPGVGTEASDPGWMALITTELLCPADTPQFCWEQAPRAPGVWGDLAWSPS